MAMKTGDRRQRSVDQLDRRRQAVLRYTQKRSARLLSTAGVWQDCPEPTLFVPHFLLFRGLYHDVPVRQQPQGCVACSGRPATPVPPVLAVPKRRSSAGQGGPGTVN